jgi:hypothetical protein
MGATIQLAGQVFKRYDSGEKKPRRSTGAKVEVLL